MSRKSAAEQYDHPISLKVAVPVIESCGTWRSA
jgi:hypothetical protein